MLPKNYTQRELSSETIGGLINSFSRHDLAAAEYKDLDLLGRVYEYFLGKFAAKEGKNAGEFYTPRSVVQVLVEMLQPYHGRVFDPACGSGGMFVQADKFVRAHGGVHNDISVFGQEANPTTWRLAKMNLAVRGIDGNLGPEWGDSFHADAHPDLRADFVIANPFFNDSNWGGDRLRQDPRWVYGTPPPQNANYAWLQHFLWHVAPTGTVGTVLANGSLSSQQNGEGDVRKKMVDADVVECIVALPPQLFYGTQIPVCLGLRAGKPASPPPNAAGRLLAQRLAGLACRPAGCGLAPRRPPDPVKSPCRATVPEFPLQRWRAPAADGPRRSRNEWSLAKGPAESRAVA